MLQQFLEPQLQQNNLGLVWFQQDGATAHTVRNLMAVLREMFPGNLSPGMVTFHGPRVRWI